MPRFGFRRGLRSNLPSTGLIPGEPLITTDRGTLHIALSPTTTIPVVPPLDELETIGSINGAEDLLLVHDASEDEGQKEKRVTFNAFRTALNIPAGSSDEQVAVVNGGEAGYLWGTDGTDGVVRGSPSIVITKDDGNGFVTLSVGVIDGGTF